MYTYTCDEPITYKNKDASWAHCETVLQVKPEFDVSQLDPVSIAQYAAFGFFVLFPLWSVAWGAKVLLKALRGTFS